MVEQSPPLGTHQGKLYQLDRLEDFCEAIYEHGTSLSHILASKIQHRTRCIHDTPFDVGKLYCPGCGDLRRVRIKLITRILDQSFSQRSEFLPKLINTIYSVLCLQCSSPFTAVIYSGTNGPSLVMLPGVLGGIGTPNTPKSVGFYLDQAYKAQAMGAHSAAMAMYRAALDQFMYQQGYKDKGKMLGAKIGQLEEDIASGKGPSWSRDLDPKFLRVLNNLGSGSIHPNDGDISKQDAIDADLIADVQTTFAELLHIAYELAAERANRLAKLTARAEVVK